jgi:enterochelin esterase family protein
MNLHRPIRICFAALLLSAGVLPVALRGEETPATKPAEITDGDTKIGPDYSDDPATKVVEGVPAGRVEHFTMDSAQSQIYPKDRGGKEFTRDAWVYIPAQYQAGSEAALLVVQDGGGYRQVVSHSLDNLIAQHRMPVTIAVMINPGPKAERSYEYDAVTSDYCDFIDKEVLPKVEADYKVKFTSDPDNRASLGGSSGGAAAFTMGWFHPERYHLIFTYSGSFAMLHPTTENPHGAWEYHEKLIAGTDAKPLKVYLEVGDSDVGADRPESSYRNWAIANEHMAAVLKAKGYHYHFDSAQGAKHVDKKVVGQTLPEVLTWLWDYHAK